MAKKRVNYKFLIFLGVPVVLLIGLAVAYKTVPQLKWMVRGTPKSHVEIAQKLYDQGKYAESAEQYLRAIQLNGGTGDAAWFLAVANCYDHLVIDDPSVNLGKMRGFLEKAITTDPTYEPALRKQLQVATDIAEQTRGANASGAWSAVGDDADALVRALPNDRDGMIAKNRAIIQGFLLSGKGSVESLDKASAALIELANRPPFNADAFAYAISAKLGRAADQQRQSDRDAAMSTAADALKLLDDAIAAHPTDAVLHYRAANLVGPLMATQLKPDAAKIGQRIVDEAAAANQFIKPEDARFIDVKLTYARALQASGKSDQAIALYNEMVKARPADVSVRLIYSEYLGNLPGRATDAIKLLSDIPAHNAGELLGVQAATSKSLDFAVIAQKLGLQVQIVPTLDHDAAEIMLTQMEQEYAQFTANGEQSAQALYLRGQLELVRNKGGDSVQAVQTLSRALAMTSSGPEQADTHLRILYALAQADLRTRQTGRAKDELRQLIDANPRFVPAQILLARTLIGEHTPDSLPEARTLLNKLTDLLPNNPDIAQMRVMTYDKKNPADRAELEKTLAGFPQETPANIIEKARLAQFLDHPDQTISLLSDLSRKPDAPPEVFAALANAYADNKQADKAIATIDAGLAKNADQPSLKILRAKLSGGNVMEVTQEAADKITDPFARESALYQLAANAGDADAMAKHLNAAEKLKPDDGRVKDLLFQLALRQGDLDHAAQLVDWLSKHNQDQANGLIFKTRLALAQAATKQGAEQQALVRGAVDSAQQLTKQLPEFAQSWVVLGQAQLAAHNFGEAEQSFAAALARQSGNADAIVGQIDAVENEGKTDYEAILLKDAEAQQLQDGRLQEQQIRYELNHGDPEKAIAPRQAQLTAALANKSANPANNYFQLAQAYVVTAERKTGDAANGFFEKALSTATDGLKVDPKNPQLAAVVAESCVRLNHIDQALAVLNQLQRGVDPKKNPGPALMLADFYARTGNGAGEEKALRDLLAAAPDTLAAQLTLTNLLAANNHLDEALALLPADSAKPEVLKQRIELLTKSGRFADAEKEIDAQLAKSAEPAGTLLDAKARVLASSGRDGEALKTIEQALAKNPADADALFYRARIHLARGDDRQQAIADLREVVRQTGNADVRMTLASALSNNGDVPGAIQMLNEIISAQPAAREPRMLLAALYARQAPPRYPQAEAAINSALAEPTLAKDPTVLNAAAELWLGPDHTDGDKALKYVNDALTAAPNDPTLQQTKLRALLAARQPRDVLTQTQPMLDLKEPPLWIYSYRGQAHAALDDKQSAFDDYSTGITAAMTRRQFTAVDSFVKEIARQVGVGPAKTRLTPLAEKGDSIWALVLSDLCVLDHDTPAAKQWVERMLANESSLSPELLAAAREQAGQLYLSGDPPEPGKAVAIYNKILQQNPKNINALNNLANTMILPNSGASPADALKPAQSAADQINAAGPGGATLRPYILDTLGWIQVLNNDPNAAIPNLKQSLEAYPLPDASYHLGEAYLKTQPPQPDQAAVSFKRAQDLMKTAASADNDLSAKITAALAQMQVSTTAPAVMK